MRRLLAVVLVVLVLAGLPGCSVLPRGTIEDLHAGWVEIEPLARKGVEASDLAPESRDVRLKLIAEYTATLEEALRHVRSAPPAPAPDPTPDA